MIHTSQGAGILLSSIQPRDRYMQTRPEMKVGGTDCHAIYSLLMLFEILSVRRLTDEVERQKTAAITSPASLRSTSGQDSGRVLQAPPLDVMKL